MAHTGRWLVYFNDGKGSLYAKRLRPRPELIAAMRRGPEASLRKQSSKPDEVSEIPHP